MNNSDQDSEGSSTEQNTENINDIKGKSRSVSPSHETAKNLVSLFTSDVDLEVHQAENFIRLYKYEEKYQSKFCNLVSRLKDHKIYLNRFFELFFSPPRDLIGDYEALFLMRCLEEDKFLELMDDKYRKCIMFSVQDMIWRDIAEDNSHSRMVLYCDAVMKSEQMETFLMTRLVSSSDLTNNVDLDPIS